MDRNYIFLQKLLISVFLIIIIFLVYGQTINYGFINIDDELYVTGNDRVKEGINIENIFWAFTTTHAANWHPLTWLSLLIDSSLFGLSAGGYHFTNLLLHLANSLLLFFLLSRLTGSTYKSAFVAALFALHPLHVESVAWVSGRKDVLSTLFWLLTVWAYAGYVYLPGWRRYCILIFFFILGILSKPMLVTLPFVLLLLDYWPLNRFASNHFPKADFILSEKAVVKIRKSADILAGDLLKEENTKWSDRPVSRLENVEQKSASALIVEKIPLFVLTLFACVITYVVQKQGGGVAPADAFPLDVRLANAVVSYFDYIVKMFWPVNLSVFYPHPGYWPFEKIILFGLFMILISLVVLLGARRYPYLAVGWLWYIGTLVPVIGLVQVGAQAMADRYTYVPLIGLFIMVSWSAPQMALRLKHKKLILSFSAAFLILVLSILSWQRCQLWSDEFTLWDDFLRNHESAFAYNVRGAGYAKRGENETAIRDYSSALKLDPNFAPAYINRASAYGEVGRYDQALRDFRQAIRINPNFAGAYYNRGLVYKNMGKLDEAIADFTEAVKFQADMEDAYLNRGVVHGMTGQHKKALDDFNQSIKIKKNFAEAYYNRGIIYNMLKQYDLAIADFEKALDINPQNAAAYNNMAFALDAMGKTKEALKSYGAALQIEPDYALANNNLGMMLDRLGRYEESIAHFEKALKSRPDYAEANRNLQAALEKHQKKAK